MLFWKVYCLLSTLSIASAKLTWGTTQFLFTFGDSYTTDGFNISAGVDSPVPNDVGAGSTTIMNGCGSHALSSSTRLPPTALIGFSSSVGAIRNGFSLRRVGAKRMIGGTYNVTDTKVGSLDDYRGKADPGAVEGV